MAIQNGNTITQFFSPIQNEPDIQTNDACLNELQSHDDIDSPSTEPEIERAVLQYCRCCQLNIKKMKASLFVTQQL
ncbi:400_t:CDS:2, partial [Funneliformis mosseae]